MQFHMHISYKFEYFSFLLRKSLFRVRVYFLYAAVDSTVTHTNAHMYIYIFIDMCMEYHNFCQLAVAFGGRHIGVTEIYATKTVDSSPSLSPYTMYVWYINFVPIDTLNHNVSCGIKFYALA